MGNGRVREDREMNRGEAMREEGKGGDLQGLVHTPMSEILKNTLTYTLIATDLIGGDGNTDFCPGQQTPSRRRWSRSHVRVKIMHSVRYIYSAISPRTIYVKICVEVIGRPRYTAVKKYC